MDAMSAGDSCTHPSQARLLAHGRDTRRSQRRWRRRLGASTAPNPPTGDAPNVVWAVDFQFDATTDGRPIKIVSILDEHTRECLGRLVDRNIISDDLDPRARPPRRRPLLSGRAALRLRPRTRLRRNGRLDRRTHRPALDPTRQPCRNGYVESFNGRVRGERLNVNMFWSLAQARVVISDWKENFNHRRRHSALGYQTPAVYGAARTHQ
jgi:putative transposase